MGSSCEGDALILFRLLGCTVNSFDRPPQLGAVGPVVHTLNEFSPPSSFVIRCRFGDLITHCKQPGEAGSCLRRSSRSSIMANISAGTCCVYSIRLPVGI